MLIWHEKYPSTVSSGSNGERVRPFRTDESNGGANVAHFQRFVSLTTNIGRFSKDLADLQDSMRTVRTLLTIPTNAAELVGLTF